MHLDFPDWFYNALHMLHCRKCKRDVELEFILALGIRKSIMDVNTTSFFIEYACPYCNAHTTMELSPMTMEDLVMEMMDKYANEEDDDDEGGIAEMSESVSGSKISKNEFVNAIEMIRDCETHYDFMLQIGMTEDQIDQYSCKDKKNIPNRKGYENN